MENEVSCTEEQMEGAVGDRAWAETSRSISKGDVGGSCPEVFIDWDLRGKERQERFKGHG